MAVYRVNYRYAAPSGALRTGASLIAAVSDREAANKVNNTLTGKLRYLQITSVQATDIEPDGPDSLYGTQHQKQVNIDANAVNESTTKRK